MHNAPSVSYPVGRSSWAAVILVALWAAGAASTACWTWQLSGEGQWRAALAWTVCLGFGGWAAHAWKRSAGGELRWTGGAWQWGAAGQDGVPGMIHVALDLQEMLLLRWQSQDETAWLWLQRTDAPECWSALRRAVYSRANPDGLQGGAPPPAIP